MANRREKVEAVTDFIFLSSKITEDSDCSHEIKTLSPWKEIYDQSRQCIKMQRHYFANKAPYRQSYVFFFFFFPVVRYERENWKNKEG